jgi:alkanesulfonate monooxygenase SsuD/methylene tetrahydromethanopterin reductase-like flavin-dependent oxidoreductase (luciferase family)
MALFGLRYDLRSAPGSAVAKPALYRAALDQCAWADRLGFALVTLSEHHGSPDGYLPSPLVMAAAIAARTEHVRIMISTLVATLYDPVRLAEDFAVLDNLSNGRILPVLSAGYVASEFESFGKRLADRKKSMDGIAGFLRQAWTGEPFQYEGRTVCVTPRPAQAHPPIWMGGSSRAAAARAAREADNFVPSSPEFFDMYREELAKLGKPDPGPRPASLGRFLYLAEDPDAAWEEIAPYLMHENNAYAAWAEAQGVATSYQRHANAQALRDTGTYPVLTPRELLEHIEAAGPWDTVLFHPLAGGMDPELAWRSLRLFEEKVYPHTALGKSRREGT